MIGSKTFQWCFGNELHDNLATDKIPLSKDDFDDPKGLVPMGQLMTYNTKCPQRNGVDQMALAMPDCPIFGFLVNHFTLTGLGICDMLKKCSMPDTFGRIVPPHKRGKCLSIRIPCTASRAILEGKGEGCVGNLVITEGERAISRETTPWTPLSAYNGSIGISLPGDYVHAFLKTASLVPECAGNNTRIEIVMYGNSSNKMT